MEFTSTKSESLACVRAYFVTDTVLQHHHLWQYQLHHYCHLYD